VAQDVGIQSLIKLPCWLENMTRCRTSIEDEQPPDTYAFSITFSQSLHSFSKKFLNFVLVPRKIIDQVVPILMSVNVLMYINP
jgi:hypothetical protein